MICTLSYGDAEEYSKSSYYLNTGISSIMELKFGQPKIITLPTENKEVFIHSKICQLEVNNDGIKSYGNNEQNPFLYYLFQIPFLLLNMVILHQVLNM